MSTMVHEREQVQPLPSPGALAGSPGAVQTSRPAGPGRGSEAALTPCCVPAAGAGGPHLSGLKLAGARISHSCLEGLCRVFREKAGAGGRGQGQKSAGHSKRRGPVGREREPGGGGDQRRGRRCSPGQPAMAPFGEPALAADTGRFSGPAPSGQGGALPCGAAPRGCRARTASGLPARLHSPSGAAISAPPGLRDPPRGSSSRHSATSCRDGPRRGAGEGCLLTSEGAPPRGAEWCRPAP